MSAVTVKVYPVDLTGRNPSNLVANEIHHIHPLHSVIIPRYGSFYTDGVIVRNASNDRLTLGRDYHFSGLQEDYTRQTGKEVATKIVITNQSLTGEINITYQVYGSDEKYTAESMKALVDAFQVQREVSWENITNRPRKFPFPSHTHPTTEITNWTEMIRLMNHIVLILKQNRYNNNNAVLAMVHQLQMTTNQKLGEMEAITRNVLSGYSSIQQFKDKLNQTVSDMKAELNSLRSLSGVTQQLDRQRIELVEEMTRRGNTITSTLNQQRERAVQELEAKITELNA